MKIADREIGPGHPVYIIAEVGLAHLGSLDLAMEMLHAAKEAGADAFKTQFWDASNPTLYSGPRQPSRCLSVQSIHSLRAKCVDFGMHFLCTPHDEYALEWISKICPAIKIGSGERGNWEFIKKAAFEIEVYTRKPIIVSCGDYTLEDHRELDRIIYNNWDARLFCISKYPTTWEDVKGQMPDFRNSIYDGWSSHTGYECYIDFAAVAAGAKIVEKHIKPFIGQEPDSSMDLKASLPIGEFQGWCENIRQIDRLFP